MDNEDSQQHKPVDTKKLFEITATGAIQIVSALTSSIPGLGGIGSMALSTWQIEQQQKLLKEVQFRFETLDQTKLDQEALKSDWFKELVIRIYEDASKTASELKQQALASVLVNSVMLPSVKLSGKLALLRILTQMSDEEITVFTAIQEGCGQHPLLSYRTETIKTFLGWEHREVVFTCKGLMRLDLLEPDENDNWRITETGRRLIAWWSGAELPEGFEVFKRSLKKEIENDVMNTLTDVFRRIK